MVCRNMRTASVRQSTARDEQDWRDHGIGAGGRRGRLDMKLPRRKRVATAQPPVHKGVGHYGPPITLDQAKKAITAAEAKARQNNWDVVISIVDSGGHAVMLQRLDGSHLAAMGIAERKVRTAVGLSRPT